MPLCFNIIQKQLNINKIIIQNYTFNIYTVLNTKLRLKYKHTHENSIYTRIHVYEIRKQIGELR